MKMDKFGAQLPPVSSTQRDLLLKSPTYLAKIAVVLQQAPNKMLTFPQLMDKVGPFIREDRKSVENNMRVCLSTNNCFVKVPLVPNSVGSKRNYWKLDVLKITTKMVRRHFKGILEFFPELNSHDVRTIRASQTHSVLHSPEPAACKAGQVPCEVKFNSPFSIESLLKRDSPPARTSPLFSMPVKAEQQLQPSHTPAGTEMSFSCSSEELLLRLSAGCSPIFSTGGSTHHGLAAKPSKRLHMWPEPPYPIYTRVSAAPYYVTYPAHTFTHDALLVRL